MRVLYVSKASIVAAYRDKLDALAAHVSVTALIPSRWGSMEAGPMEDTASGVRIHTAAALLHGRNHLHAYAGAGAVVRAASPDIVHLDEEPYSTVTCQFAFLCRRRRIPFVFFAWQNLHKPLPVPFGLMRRFVYAGAAAGIAGTARAADVLKRGGWRGPTAVIPQLGVAPERFRSAPDLRTRMRARLGVAEGAFVVGYAGRLVAEKGVDLLLEAAAPLERATVLLIGAGPERRRLAARAHRLGMAARTHFAGSADSTEMPAWLNALDALVLPSRRGRGWTEQFGRVLVEAMACGVPVVGAISGEIPAVVGSAGLLFAEEDVAALRGHLERLAGAPELRHALGAAGRARALSHYTQERIARDTVDLYEVVLGRAR